MALEESTDELQTDDDMIQLTQNDPQITVTSDNAPNTSGDVLWPFSREAESSDNTSTLGMKRTQDEMDISEVEMDGTEMNAGETQSFSLCDKSCGKGTTHRPKEVMKTIRWHRPPPPKSEFKGNKAANVLTNIHLFCTCT